MLCSVFSSEVGQNYIKERAFKWVFQTLMKWPILIKILRITDYSTQAFCDIPIPFEYFILFLTQNCMSEFADSPYSSVL